MITLLTVAAAIESTFRDRDSAGFAALFAADGTFVTIEGRMLHGQDQIRAVHEQMFSELAEGVFQVSVAHVRLIAATVSVGHVLWSLDEPSAVGLLTLVVDADGAIVAATNVVGPPSEPATDKRS